MRRLVLLAAVFAPLVALLLAPAACQTDEDNTAPGCSDGTPCTNGAGSLQACFTRDSKGACSTLSYKVGAQLFQCVSCTDQAYCANAAAVACGIADASIPLDASLPDGVSLAPVDAGHRD